MKQPLKVQYYEKYYVYNTFTTNPRWQVVTNRQKSNFSGGVRLKTHKNLPLRICCENVVVGVPRTP